MTKEERELSITYLEKMKEDYIEGEGYERHPLPEYYAIETVIKALEQQSDDCVSRQAVLDCLTATGLKKFDFILDARDKVRALPPVTPKITKGATNGDTIKAIFPSTVYTPYMSEGMHCAIGDERGIATLDCSKEWWNAPYTEKRGNSDGSN